MGKMKFDMYKAYLIGVAIEQPCRCFYIDYCTIIYYNVYNKIVSST